MIVTYDFEFLDDGRTIDPISVGLVAEDSRAYYAVNEDAPWDRIREHEWLAANVLPRLPGSGEGLGWELDVTHLDMRTIGRLRDEVLDFLRVGLREGGEDADLWAYYPAYDHVTLCQMWGPMVDKPWGVPMRTSCLKQHAVNLGAGCPPLPRQDPATEHHAFFDAVHDMAMARAMGIVV